MPGISLGELADRLGAVLENGSRESTVTRLAGLSEAGPDAVSFLANPKYSELLSSTRAGAVIAGRTVSGAPCALLRVDNPDLAFGKAAEILLPPVPRPSPGIHPSATVSPEARIGRDVSIGAGSVVEAGASVGDRTALYPQTYIGAETEVGPDCLFYPQTVVYHRVRIGARCIVHSGAVIGSDGFGYAWTGSGYYKIPQAGTVIIEDDVEIGANTCVDRARFGETRIGRGTKLDNLLQIAHNVKIGALCAFAAQTGIAGSTTIGDGVQAGGHCAIVGHISIGDGISLVGATGVSKNIPGKESGVGKERLVWIGTPAKPMEEQLREWQQVKSLGRLRKTVKELEKRLEKMEKEAE